MTRRLLVSAIGLIVFHAVSWQPPWASTSSTRVARKPILEAALLAVERENGCADDAEPAPAPAPQAWPDWASAHIAGGDVPPARVISDPYPTLHSVVVDADHNRVFVSDPNRHA